VPVYYKIYTDDRISPIIKLNIKEYDLKKKEECIHTFHDKEKEEEDHLHEYE
jgi:hypothetical protein